MQADKVDEMEIISSQIKLNAMVDEIANQINVDEIKMTLRYTPF